MMKNRLLFLAIIAALSVNAQSSPPNIVLLLADDLGWTDLACFGSDFYETPNLDRLCRQGMKFTSAYSAAANCAPSRACMITGQYTPRHGVYTVGSCHRFDKGTVGWGGRIMEGPDRDARLLLAPECAKGIGAGKLTIGSALKEAGYRTGYFGKWHTGWGGPIPLDAWPDQVPSMLGFDESALCDHDHYNIKIWPEPEMPIPPDKYLSDYLADRAADFIERNQSQPFFLYYSDFLVHVPLDAPKERIEKYQKKPVSGFQTNAVYAAMVESLDKSCGRILDKLDELGLTDNTLVVFTSDNGGVASNKKNGYEYADGLTSNYPLRGMKGMFTEGGIRVPTIARWPGHIRPGICTDEPVIGVDWFPTFAAAAGSSVNKKTDLLDGENLIPVFEGSSADLDRSLFWYFPGYLPGRQAPAAVIRQGSYKLIHFFEDDHVELYNLLDDIGETTDLSVRQPEKAQQLKATLAGWRTRTGAVLPQHNPDPKVGVMKIGGGWGPIKTDQ